MSAILRGINTYADVSAQPKPAADDSTMDLQQRKADTMAHNHCVGPLITAWHIGCRSGWVRNGGRYGVYAISRRSGMQFRVKSEPVMITNCA